MRSHKWSQLESETAVTTNLLNQQHNMPEKRHPKEAILIIDDNSAIREALSTILSLFLENTIYTQSMGTKVYRFFMQNNIVFSLIFLDIEMPGMKGKEVYEKLQQIEPQIKAIVSSSLSYTEAKSRFKKQDLLTYYLQKPYDIDTPLKVIQADIAEEQSILAEPHRLNGGKNK